MFESLVVINFCLPWLYVLVFVLYIVEFFKSNTFLQRAKRYALAAVSGIHFIHLVLLTLFYGSLPIANVYQLLTTVAFTLVIVYLFIELSTGESSTGSFMLLAALTFQSISSLFLFSASPTELNVRSPLLSLHIITAILGYSSVAIAGVYSSLYMALFCQIRANRFGTLFDRLPNLETLEKMSLHAVRIGFIFLSFAFIAGVMWIPHSQGRFHFTDAKLIGLIMVWLIYGISLLLRKRLGWQGQRMAVLFTLGFLFSFLSMTVLNLFSPRFHSLN